MTEATRCLTFVNLPVDCEGTGEGALAGVVSCESADPPNRLDSRFVDFFFGPNMMFTAGRGVCRLQSRQGDAGSSVRVGVWQRMLLGEAGEVGRYSSLYLMLPHASCSRSRNAQKLEPC